MLVQDEWGRLSGKTSGTDFINKAGCLGDVGADANSAAPMALAVDELPFLGDLGAGGLGDG